MTSLRYTPYNQHEAFVAAGGQDLIDKLHAIAVELQIPMVTILLTTMEPDGRAGGPMCLQVPEDHWRAPEWLPFVVDLVHDGYLGAASTLNDLMLGRDPRYRYETEVVEPVERNSVCPYCQQPFGPEVPRHHYECCGLDFCSEDCHRQITVEKMRGRDGPLARLADLLGKL